MTAHPAPTYAIPGTWAQQADCRGVGHLFVIDPRYLFDRRPGPVARARAAKRICATCPVITQCRQWALTDPDPAVGLVAGGLDPLERRKLRIRSVA